MTIDIEDGSKFPDLGKAGMGKKLEDLVKGFLKDDREFYDLAQVTKQKLLKQKEIDLKSFLQSQAGAIERGNTHSCNARHDFGDIAAKAAEAVVPIVLPPSTRKSATGNSPSQNKMPKTRSVAPTRGARSKPPSIARLMVNQNAAAAVGKTPYLVQQIKSGGSSEKSERNFRQFARAQSGFRNTSIGDRAIVFSANGTPYYGDSYLDKNVVENAAANQATTTVPLSQIPPKIKQLPALNTDPLQQNPRANVAPKSNSVGNMAVLGGIAAAVTSVLFFFQYVLMFVQFIMQVSQSTATITNIASSFVAILNNLGSLLGLGEDALKPLEETFDSILNNTFGKEKVDYVKFQFAKISGVFVAGQNILNSFGGFKNKLTNLVTRNSDNTSKIGNALKMVGMIADTETWMNENNKVNSVASGVKDKLENISGLADTLTEITETVKTSKEQIEIASKTELKEDENDKEGEKKVTEKYEDKDTPDVRALEEPAS